jgi:predicted flavoprotein YhiN
MSSKQYDVLVIGAGASGLMTAYMAAQRGRKVVVVEKANKVGKKILMVNACKVVQKIHQQQIILLAIEDITELRKHGG